MNYLQKLYDEYPNMTKAHIWSMKSQYEYTYKELYEDLTDRDKTVAEIQDLCIELTWKDLIRLDEFKGRNQALPVMFLNSVYRIRDGVPRIHFIEKCKRVIQEIKDGNLH